MEILAGLLSEDAVIIAVFITSMGVGLKALKAKWERKSDFDIRLTGMSTIIGFLVSLQLVITALEHVSVDAPSTVWLTIIAGEILTVMGVDSASKAVGRKIVKDN